MKQKSISTSNIISVIKNMKKILPLINMELSEAAVKDAEKFGITAFIEGEGENKVVCFESKAYMEDSPKVCVEDMHCMVKAMLSEFEYQTKWMREDISYLRDAFYKHTGAGHLPHIADAGSMTKALKVLGLGDSYKVEIPRVYVQY
jgi:hypothetical protein